MLAQEVSCVSEVLLGKSTSNLRQLACEKKASSCLASVLLGASIADSLGAGIIIIIDTNDSAISNF